MLTKNKRLVGIVATVALLLMIPLVAMQFTDQVKWSAIDFLIAATLLLGTGLLCEVVWRKVQKRSYRIAFSVALLIVLFLVWAELAVGIFGSPWAGN